MPTVTPSADPVVDPDHVALFTPECCVCHKHGFVVALKTEWAARQNLNAPIQIAMPSLTPNEREQIISGVHPACWDELFGQYDWVHSPEPRGLS